MSTWVRKSLLISLCLFLISCQAQKPAGSSTSSSNVCGSGGTLAFSSLQGTALPLMANQIKARAMTGKLQLDGFELISKKFDNIFQSFNAQTESTMILPAGSEIVLSVKTVCQDDEVLAHARDFMHFKKESPFKDAINKIPAFTSRTVIIDQELSADLLLNLFDQNSCIRRISSSILMQSKAPNDPWYNSGLISASQRQINTHLNAVNWGSAYTSFYGNHSSTDVVIAIIDSGVDIAHNDLDANIWINTDEIANNGIDDDGNGFIDDRNGWNFASSLSSPAPITWPSPYNGDEAHGTHVAGLAGAETNNSLYVTGVMGQNVQMMALNVFGGCPYAETADIDNAIAYASANGAHVINLSLGGFGAISSTRDAIQDAVDNGSVVFAAAGNSGVELTSSTFMTPASYAKDISGFISVGSIDGKVGGGLSSFSNYSGTYVEIGAPGAYDSLNSLGLISTIPSNGIASSSGTSMACPIVAGAAAFAMSAYHDQNGSFPTPAYIETNMLAQATTTVGLGGTIKNNKVLDINALIDFIVP